VDAVGSGRAENGEGTTREFDGATAEIELLNHDPSPLVSDVRPARMCLTISDGRWHLGRFSRVYRCAYGEYPSETIRAFRYLAGPIDLAAAIGSS
jgi:hypothetical protein